ncbi:methionyl-tRNA formyltransferase [Pedobacter heparinus]|uniref:Formyl transferase domain protein n=1 Tax=Pedobacter heparinus (strain ATCC 13125 / DSM 2366 / CIP 104194 / JCM 7457 / NBRC 12017 / NCIMB 9290 / NRRL B-14731 / HIM 762-3) TaxID=485917 RepID=C6XVQ9_PEDHD|nr:methionyl-tRNA formyltransferase [Pedobacter heparinus]ACU06134.1 formyl transferase domain protein [Pedobacter heparinus DSM 2366]
MSNYKFGILASGRLGFICLNEILKQVFVGFVFTDSKSNNIIDLCNSINLPVFVGNPRNEKSELFLKQFDVDFILSINYLYLVDESIFDFPKGYAINFHGSLLPKYRGRTPHVWAIINNEIQTGITAHLISKNCDEGDIVYQEVIPIGPDTTGGDILAEFERRFPICIKSVIESIENGSIKPVAQNNEHATYYGKRSPKDGMINWNWQKERIKNWVRAQAKPYPGAFSYVNDKKIIIHKVKFVDIGFADNDVNGEVISVQEGIVVKTQNGALMLIDYEVEGSFNFEIGDILYARD